jgi:hypothetical protein
MHAEQCFRFYLKQEPETLLKYNIYIYVILDKTIEEIAKLLGVRVVYKYI